MQSPVPRTVKILTGIWVCGLIAGSMPLIDYSAAPGAIVEPPEVWPTTTVLPRQTSRSTMVMFVHPRCPCSQASINELARVAAHGGERMEMIVVFVRPPGAPPEWITSSLKDKAGRIPRVQVVDDPDGQIAATFGMKTSGHCVVYGIQGTLLFSGGITAGRGHEGSSPGQSIVTAIARGNTVDPVQQCASFGCPLFSAQESLSADLASSDSARSQ